MAQEDDYTTDCLMDYPCIKENYKLITIQLLSNIAAYNNFI